MSSDWEVPASALEYARRHELHALVATRDDSIVLEEYGDGYDITKPHALYSGTKSFWGVVAVAAQRDGILRLDERVAETIAEWKTDERKRKITLRQLLQLTSGIGFGGLGMAVPTYQKALAVEIKNEPDTTFTYSGIPLQVFGAVLARKLQPRGLTPHAYLYERILDPLGLRAERWRALSDGTHPLPTGAFLAAREWLKYGRFIIERRGEFEECFRGSRINPRYGLGFWVGIPNREYPSDLVYASGAGGQALYIVPSQKLAIVHFGGSSSYKHEAFLERFFGA